MTKQNILVIILSFFFYQTLNSSALFHKGATASHRVNSQKGVNSHVPSKLSNTLANEFLGKKHAQFEVSKSFVLKKKAVTSPIASTGNSSIPALNDLPLISYISGQGRITPPVEAKTQATVFAVFDSKKKIQYVGFSKDVRNSLRTLIGRRPELCYYYKLFHLEELDQTKMLEVRNQVRKAGLYSHVIFRFSLCSTSNSFFFLCFPSLFSPVVLRAWGSSHWKHRPNSKVIMGKAIRVRFYFRERKSCCCHIQGQNSSPDFTGQRA